MFFHIFYGGALPPRLENMYLSFFGNSENQEKPFTEKILHPMKKVKKTDPPKTTQKTDLID